MAKLIDIAKACELDVSTVSRALHNDPRVTQKTKDKVLKIADSLNYQPNWAARNLARGKTDAVVLLLPSIKDNLCIEATQTTSKILMNQSKDLILQLHHDDIHTYQRILNRISPGYCDGLLLVPSVNKIEYEILMKTLPLNVPLVFVDRWFKDMDIPVVTTDNENASYELVKKMAEQGCNYILNGFTQNNEVNLARFNGTQKAIKELNLKEISSDITSFSKHDRIGIISTSQSRVLTKARELFNQSIDLNLYFACFDDWKGEPHPSKKVFVCIQDFATIIQKAVDILFNLAEYNINSGSLINLIQHKEIMTIEKSF